MYLRLNCDATLLNKDFLSPLVAAKTIFHEKGATVEKGTQEVDINEYCAVALNLSTIVLKEDPTAFNYRIRIGHK